MFGKKGKSRISYQKTNTKYYLPAKKFSLLCSCQGSNKRTDVVLYVFLSKQCLSSVFALCNCHVFKYSFN